MKEYMYKVYSVDDGGSEFLFEISATPSYILGYMESAIGEGYHNTMKAVPIDEKQYTIIVTNKRED